MLKHMQLENIPQPKEYSFAITNFQGGLNTAVDDQNMTFSESPLAYNVTVADGSLKRCTGYGRAKRYVRDAGEEKVLDWLPAGDGLMMLYKTHHGSGAWEHLAFFNKQGLSIESYNKNYNMIEWEDIGGNLRNLGNPGFYVNYRLNNTDCMVFGGSNLGLYIWNDPATTPIKVINAPSLHSGVIHYERLFGVGDPDHINRIWFSAQFNPTDFTVSLDRGGYIDVLGDKGRALKVMSFMDAVYVFWQYGISRIKAYSYQSDFSYSEIYSCDSEILPNSIQLCGDQVIFAAKNGVYRFDGVNVTLISGKLNRFFTESAIAEGTECSAFFRQKYYLALGCPAQDNYQAGKNNVMFEYDFFTSRFRMYKDCDIRQMFILHDFNQEKLLLICGDGYIYNMDGSDMFGTIPIQARWDTPYSNLGQPHLIKTCKELLMTASGEGMLKITLQTEAQSCEKLLRLYPEAHIARLRFNVKGKLVRLSIENVNGNNFKVANPVVIYTVNRDGRTV